jgi:beta-D-xylosidase 4
MYVFLVLLLTITTYVNGQNDTYPDCKAGPLATFPICDLSVPSRQRAADLISRMNISEKISLLTTASPAIPRLGLPAYNWESEALHGLAFSPGIQFLIDLFNATSFPMNINLGATFNMTLVNYITGAIATEARAFSNAGRTGLDFFTPNINIFRDPRWGRGQETAGEDPYLASQYAYAYVTGFQEGDDKRYIKAAASCKHYVAYDLERWNGTDRFHFNAIVSDQDIVETHLPPFESCVRDAHVASIMCSLNAINGIPACGDQFFLQTILRDEYKFDGFVVSDCGAIQDILTSHNYTNTSQDTVALALHAGTDLDCGQFYPNHTQQALDEGTVVEADVDQALIRNYNILVRLGYFDPPESQPYRQIPRSAINTDASKQLTLESAQQSIVLLKNLNNALPLNMNQLTNKTIALIGPTSNATKLMQGIYAGRAPYLIDPFKAFKTIVQNYSINIQFAYGCNIIGNDESYFAEAMELARSSDIVFFFAGLNNTVEKEGHDRITITLPDIQLSLLQQLENVVRSPLHVVVMSGSSLDLTFIRDSPQYASLIWAGYPGQSGGAAIASVVFGQYNPAGHLPITFYPASYVNQVNMTDMSMRPSSTNPGRTYKFYTGQPVFEFGFGLSYTTFSYAWYNDSKSVSYSIQSLMKTNSARQNFLMQIFRVNVTNTGMMDGDDVVLAYVTPPQVLRDGQTPPIKQLFGFERIHLGVNETKQVFFPFNIETLFTVARDGSKWLHSGQYHILIGNQHMFTVELHGDSALWKRFR